MRLAALCAVIIGLVALVCGCGGGSGSGSSTSPFVNIESQRFYQKSTNIRLGGMVQFRNVDSQPHQVVSGVLVAIGNPAAEHIININMSTLDPRNSEENYGDTIEFNNQSGLALTIQIVDDNGQIISQIPFNVGQMRQISFPGPGYYTLRNQSGQVTLGSIVLYGRPVSNGLFQSQVLSNGQIFPLEFTSTGTYTFFSPDLVNPDRSFITGTIVVQP